MNEITTFKQIIIPNCKFTKTSLTISDGISKEQWTELGSFLKTVEGCVQFWIGDWIRFGEKKWGEKYKEAIEKTGLDYGTLRDYKWVAEKVDLSLRNDKLDYQHHKQIASLSPKEQEKWLNKAETENLTIRELRQAIRGSKPFKTSKTLEGEYNVIVIDPPWNYGTEYDPQTRRVGSPYPEIPTENLELSKYVKPANDCVLWLWTTHRFLPDALKLVGEWGFDYKLTLVWNKERMGIGSWLRCQVEFCLLGIKGSPQWRLTNERDFIQEARREHSRKPESFYLMVKKLCGGKMADIFSREKHDGFDPYGNETDKF